MHTHTQRVRRSECVRPVPAALVLAVVDSGFDSIEQVIVDAVVDGRCDPRVARGLLYATVAADLGSSLEPEPTAADWRRYS